MTVGAHERHVRAGGDPNIRKVDALVGVVVHSFEEAHDVDAALQRLGVTLLAALLKPDLIRLRRLVIATADRFPEVAQSWYQAGFGRVLHSLADGFSDLHKKGLLRVPDAPLAAQHFAGLLLWIPLNRAMFGATTDTPSKHEVERLVKDGVRAFLSGYQPPEAQVSQKLKRSIKKP